MDSFVDVRPKCTVCLEQVLLDGYALLNCSHVFHVPCIARCLREMAACPNCRIPVDSSVLFDLGVPRSSSPVARPQGYVYRGPPVFAAARPQSFAVVRPTRVVSTPSSTTAAAISSSSSGSSNTNSTTTDLSQDSEESSSSSESDSSGVNPVFYRTFILNFLKTLNLTDDQNVRLVSFKRRYGKYALCDAVIRVKVFLALDRDFRFTSLEDMLHRCKNDCRSARLLEKIYLKYLRVESDAGVTKKGSVYDFFDLPEPRVRNSDSVLLERSFQNIIQKRFGVTLPVVDRDIALLNFYKRYPHNLHDVLRYAKLRCKEKDLKKQIMGLKNGLSGCRRKRRNGWF